MGIAAFLLFVVLVGLGVWAAQKWVPMSEPIKKALPYFALALLIVLLLVLLLGGAIHDVQIPRLRW